MATIVQPNFLCIAIDPGFDSTKVVVGGHLFDIPNSVLDVTGRTTQFLSINNNKKAEGYLLSRYIPDKEYLVGHLARKTTLDRQVRETQTVRHGMMDSAGRFQTTDFEVNLMTCIGLALVKYSKLSMENNLKPQIDLSNPDELMNLKLIIGVALPNDWAEEVGPGILKFLVNEFHFSLETTEGNFDLHFKIEKGHAMYLSQAICALLGAASTDAGDVLPDSEVLNNLPCIVIDGGYKTVGIFELSNALQVIAAESNTEYAMGNIHKNVAQILKEKYNRENIEDFQIPAILENGGVINVLSDDGTGKKVSKQVNVKKLIDEEEEKICNELIEYLNDKFENLLDIKEVLITGGTGAAYYAHIAKYLDEQRGHLKGHVILTEYAFLGNKIEPVFAIAVGMYKTLRNEINKASRKKK